MYKLDANSAFVIVSTAKAPLMEERGLCILSLLEVWHLFTGRSHKELRVKPFSEPRTMADVKTGHDFINSCQVHQEQQPDEHVNEITRRGSDSPNCFLLLPRLRRPF